MRIALMWLRIPIIIFALTACEQKVKEQEIDKEEVKQEEKYSSLDCQTGDITLTLKPDWTFDLTILFWDNNTRKHTGKEFVEGGWKKNESLLTLKTNDGNTIVYRPIKTPMSIGSDHINATTYAFVSNTTDFFGSGYDLLLNSETDKFFKEHANALSSSGDTSGFIEMPGSVGRSR